MSNNNINKKHGSTQQKSKPGHEKKVGIPKWKMESLAFRASLKQSKGGQISK